MLDAVLQLVKLVDPRHRDRARLLSMPTTSSPMRSLRLAALALLAAGTLLPSLAAAGASDAAKCVASKLKAAAKACACRHDRAAKAVSSGDPADFAKCATDLAGAFGKAELKADGRCPANGEVTTVDGRITALVDDLSTALLASTATGKAARACTAAKLKAAGKHCACRHKAEASAATKGITPDFSKCESKLAAAFVKADAKGAGACPTSGDGAATRTLLDDTCAEVEADIANRGTTYFAARGPYGVGTRTMTLVDTSRPTAANGVYPGAPERTLVVDVWYPAPPAPQAQVLNAAVAGGGPFPLIVRAHGFSGFRYDSTYIVQHLASHGYVVVAPDFPLSTLGAPGGPTIADVGEQARDLSYLIDQFTAFNADSGSPFFGAIDTATIGAIGHSLGGATVEVATFHGTLRDPRIEATVALSPLACAFVDGFYDAANVPLMVEGGTVDMITPYTSNHLNPWAYVQAPKYLLELDGGTHLGFSDRLLFTPTQNGDAELGCSLFVQPGDPRPVDFDVDLPPDYLGGPALGVDPTGSMCEPICPLPPPTFMLHGRQNTLAKAASLAFFEAKLRGSVSGGRMITGQLDAENDDALLFVQE